MFVATAKGWYINGVFIKYKKLELEWSLKPYKTFFFVIWNKKKKNNNSASSQVNISHFLLA